MTHPSGLGEYTTEELQQELASRNHVRHMPEMVSEGESDTAERDTKLWYIVTEFGSDVVMGGFETKDLALEVRQMVENQAINRALNKTYAIEQRKALEKVMGGK